MIEIKATFEAFSGLNCSYVTAKNIAEYFQRKTKWAFFDEGGNVEKNMTCYVLNLVIETL